MKHVLPIVVCLIACSIRADAGLLPPYMTPCDYNDQNIHTCIVKEIEKSVPIFTKGIPDLSVPSIDPVGLDDIIIDENNLKVIFKNSELSGLSNMHIKDLQFDIRDHKEFDFVIDFKGDLKFTSKYNASGQILILPITGNGDAIIEARDVEVKLNSKLNVAKIDDLHYIKLSSPNYKYDIGLMQVELSNLFNGNKELSQTTIKFINENWKVLLDEFAPPIIKQIAATVVKSLNKFFSHVAVEKMVKNYPGSN